MKVLLIAGGKSTSIEIREVVEQFYKDIYDIVYNIIGDNEEISDAFDTIKDKDLKLKVNSRSLSSCEIFYIIGFSNPLLRVKFINLFESLRCKAINVIHPSAYIATSAIIGEGNYIAANSVISSNAKIGNHNIINYSVTIGHDASIDSNCTLNPGSRVSGNVTLGNRILIGANSFIFQGKAIGNDVLIDALTYIDRDIPENSICSSKQVKVFKRVQ